MPYYCTVPRCTSMAGKAKNVSFHQFPRDEELANLWNEVLKRGKPYTKYSKVCSLHFKPEDYTITSVGKNKGQWRTLRKDAVPSQNLPSDTPAPWPKPRRASANTLTSSPSRNSFNGSFDTSSLPNIMPKDLMRGFEMAQAIYMQTMLAMQAAQVKSDGRSISNEPHSSNSRSPSPASSTTSCVNETPDSNLDGQPTDTPNTSYKCNDCSKCFKDPDVLIIHKRTHIKSGEKENLDLNLQNRNDEALKSNPILVNLLKNGIKPEVSNLFDVNSILSIENQIMTALAANMENYIRNLSSMVQTNDTNRNVAENPGVRHHMDIETTIESQFPENQGDGSLLGLVNADVRVENCDNGVELNGSVDSDNLVIDETA